VANLQAVQVAPAFTQIAQHSAYPFLDEKWKQFARLLKDKADALTGLPDDDYSQQFDAYVDELSGQTAVEAFEKYQDLLNEAAKVQLEVMGYSPTQIRKLFGFPEGKTSKNRILTEGIEADVVSIGANGELTVFEEKEEEEEEEVVEDEEPTPPFAGIPIEEEWEGVGEALEEWEEEVATVPKVVSVVGAKKVRFPESRMIPGQGRLPGIPAAPPPTFEALLTRVGEVADNLEEVGCDNAAEELMTAVQSLTPDMDATEVSEIFRESEEALIACDDWAESIDLDLEPQWEHYNAVVALSQFYVAGTDAPQEEEEEEEEVVPTDDDREEEEELVEEAQVPSENVVGLATAVVALAQEANRTTLYHFTELSQQTTQAGAPKLGVQFIKILTNAAGMAPTPADLGRNIGKQAANVGGDKYQLAGPAQARIVTAFATSHPSSVIGTANGIIKGLKDAGILKSGAAEKALKCSVTKAVSLFESMEDVPARVEVFGFTENVAKLLANNNASPKMPTRIIGVEEPAEPADIIAAGPDPEEVLEEAEEAADHYVAPPATTTPAEIDPTPEDEQPSVPSATPSQGNLISLIASVNGNPEKFIPLIAATYSGYSDAAAITSASKAWLKSLITQPNTRFALRWTNVCPAFDIIGVSIFDTTHRISAAPDGNQPPNAPMWRQVGIPTAILKAQERAYIEAGGVVKTNKQYQDEYAEKSLQGPPQDSEVLIPSEIKTPYYFIETDDDGTVTISINEDAYQGAISNPAFRVEGSEGGVTTLTNGFGSIEIMEGGTFYTVANYADNSEAVTGFLVMLENLQLAVCGGVLCVSNFLAEEAETEGLTLPTLTQGVLSFNNEWETAFSNALTDEVHTFSATTNGDNHLVITLAAGPEDYKAQVCVKAVPTSGGEVRYGVKLVIASETVVAFESRLPYKEFIEGTPVATEVVERVSETGRVLGVAAKVVTISGDALSSEQFSGILDSLRSGLQEGLKASAKYGVTLQRQAYATEDEDESEMTVEAQL